MVDGCPEQGAGEGHQQGCRDTLAGHVRDADRDPASPATDPEHVEEVAADLARRLVVAGDLVAWDRRWDERDETSLDAPPERQLGLEPDRGGRRGVGARDRLVRQLGERRQAGHDAGHDRLEERPVGRAPTDDAADRPTAGLDGAIHLDRAAQAPGRAARREHASLGVLDGDRDTGSARSSGAGAVEWRDERAQPGEAEPFDRHRRRLVAQNASSAVARSGWMWNSRSRPVRWRTRSTAG